MKLRIALLVLSTAFLMATAEARNLSNESECQAINGRWTLQAGQPARFATCVLDQAYTIAPHDTLSLVPGVDLAVIQNGQLIIDGLLYLPNTSSLSVELGRVNNNGEIRVDNRASILHNGGFMTNTGMIDLEGDLIVNYTRFTPNGHPYCVNNSGEIFAYSGGNILNRGCMNTISSGVLRTDATSHVLILSGGRYSGANHVLNGRFEIEYNAVAHLTNARLASMGHLINRGQLFTFGDHFTIDSQAVAETTGIGARLDIRSSTLQVNGELQVHNGVLDTQRNVARVMVGDAGSIVMSGMARSISDTMRTDVYNDGLILRICLATWGPTRSHHGNPVYYRRCSPLPIPPRPPLPPIGL